MVEIEGEDDVEPTNKAENPRLPSPADVAEHNRTHIPYRSWCKWCVEGRGRGEQHRASPGSSVPSVGLDYFFITSGGVMKRNELEYELDAAGEEQLDNARARAPSSSASSSAASTARMCSHTATHAKGQT